MHARTHSIRHTSARHRGAAAILAMMFLVIFSGLAAAMAIVSEGNLIVADSNLRVSRSLAAAETGMQYMVYRMNRVSREITTRDGVITSVKAAALYDLFLEELIADMESDPHNISAPVLADGVLTIGPIAVGPGAPQFIATLTPHPIAGENYSGTYYQRAPYNDTSIFNPVVSTANPLDARWVRLRVEATDRSQSAPITRSIQMDFKIEKKIKFAILSKNRVMIGRNVMIEGPIGSRFMETNLQHGHPIQMESDFLGLDPDTSADGLDAQLQTFRNTLSTNDINGDNRINVTNASETDGILNPAQYDKNNDGYIDDYDFFVGKYDANADGKITAVELDTANHVSRAQLLSLIDTFGNPGRAGYGDGVIDDLDNYSKVRGEVLITATMAQWNAGAANGQYQDYFQGAITPNYQQSPVTFGASEASVAQFGPEDFDVTTLKNKATGDLNAQAAAAINAADPNAPEAPQLTQLGSPEEVPFGSAHPYDYYNRPVYRNMTFTNVTIPKGTNALFENCKFIGVTFVDTEVNNNDEFFNYNGMMDATGKLKHADKVVTIGDVTIPGNDPNNSTKNYGNNVRFNDCSFEGAVVSAAPQSYTQVRNKINFTGNTTFADLTSPAATPNLTQAERELYRRSTILAPHMSVEMGTFVGSQSVNQVINLSGTIVAGVIDMRGDIKIDGTLMTTFEPISETGPVIGETSPNFNTTLGYFSKATGDFEAEAPDGGLGKIRIRYDPTLPLPDGILAPISFTPLRASYFEGGAR